MTSRPSPLHRWYSICSMHRVHSAECRLCQAGHWVFEPGAILSRLHFKIAPDHWRKRANR